LKNHKLIFVILDGVGIGELPDAASYGDRGANTVGNVARHIGGLQLPSMQLLGLGRIASIEGVDSRTPVEGCFGKMAEQSKGKDSTTGHWEIAGIITEKAFPVYLNGFPAPLMSGFLAATGARGFLGNKPASGTEIIMELGDEHVRTGFPIVYTSGDSVFQIACHEEVVPLSALYEMCRKTRTEVTVGEHRVGRVIARPFAGKNGRYTRTANRKDFAVEPPGMTVLDLLEASGVETRGIGKIDDLFAGRGLKVKIHTHSNAEGIEQILEQAGSMESGLLMANLVDFDMLFGHRQDPEGFAKALKEFDLALPDLLECLKEGDLLILTADHGNDPTDQSTDHSREYVPLLCYCRDGKKGVDLGTRKTFADAGKTIAEFFGVSNSLAGTSFLSMVM
jgi:phosphopentomutase